MLFRVFCLLWKETLMSRIPIAGNILHAICCVCDIWRETLVGEMPIAVEILHAICRALYHLERGPGGRNGSSR